MEIMQCVQSGGGANMVAYPYSKKTGLATEIIGTFVLVYTVFSATDPKRNAHNSHVPVLAPLLIGFAVFMVHLATIPITGTGINPARSFGAAAIYGHKKSWYDHNNGGASQCGAKSEQKVVNAAVCCRCRARFREVEAVKGGQAGFRGARAMKGGRCRAGVVKGGQAGHC
ncbi:hypothetical protein L7F22_033612 [Adiantum nelumboides]|nr:hypothetical protein [Adiantum nelumboides]